MFMFDRVLLSSFIEYIGKAVQVKLVYFDTRKYFFANFRSISVTR